MFSRKTLLRPVQPDSSGLWRTITRFVPIGIALVGIVAGVMVFLSHERALVQLKERVHEENQIRMHSTLEHVQDYFDSVHSTLLFVSLDESVKAMRKDSRGFIQRLYDHQWEHHRLSEVYIVERDFPGTRRPFQTFERGWEDQPADELHTLTRELEEYQTQRRHVGQFLAHTHLPALISSEVMLCVNDPEGQRARGLVYSVPIYSTNGLAGIVAGMIPTHILQQILKRDQYQQVALLINSRGEIYGGQESHAPLRSWFEEQFNQQEASQFFARGARAFAIDRFNALWNPVKVVSAEKWWLVYLYDREAHLQRSSFAGRSGHAALAGMIVAVGVVLGLMAHLTAERLEDKVRHLRDRTQLERQVQAASQREQRRIGENLHEDLCQRLAGAEAAG
ncbi:MAG TPA: hypothetical protein VEC99_18320, partial [Clostridia bacterium]|nr:hypothetical protein [Clostridia bacterium]